MVISGDGTTGYKEVISLFQKQKEELMEKVRGMEKTQPYKKEEYQNLVQHQIQQMSEIDGFNQALDDVIKLLK